MKFDKILIEKKIQANPYAKNIIKAFPNLPQIAIDSIDDVFGQVKKPYLQKRQSLSIFIGEKKGELVKAAPKAYGVEGDPHYYYIHSYNCIYECQYCYLQGYFNSPDLVFFVNHHDIISRMSQLYHTHNQQTIWFHGGEYSDSLATSSITGELELYWDFFSRHPRAMLELRTKSSHIKELINRQPLENIIVSFSLSPANKAKEHDLNAPPLESRLVAMKKLMKKGFSIAIHFDPIIYSSGLEIEYRELIDQLDHYVDVKKIKYLSLGVVRFTKKVYFEVKKNYPHSTLWRGEWAASFDGKKRYPKSMRLQVLKMVKKILIEKEIKEESIYLCMEG